MKITNKTIRICAREMGLKINFSNKREVALFQSTIAFNVRRRSVTEKREFWDKLRSKRGCNARSIWNSASTHRGRRIVKLMGTIAKTNDAHALFSLSSKMRDQKCYELSNMSYDYATKLLRKNKTRV